MIIKKGTKASEIDIYRNCILPQITTTGEGTYTTLTKSDLITFVAIPKLRKEEINDFEYRTKKMGYLTNDDGMISLIVNGLLFTEASFWAYHQYKEVIKDTFPKSLTVVLIDSVKNRVEAIKLVEIPEVIGRKLQEQWLLSIEKNISQEAYNRWISCCIYGRDCKANLEIAEELQTVKDSKAKEIFLFI